MTSAAAAATGPAAVVEQLCRATNDHDLEGIVACFGPDYRAEMPVHPDRGFIGRGQVRTNWEQILTFVPDLTVQVQRCTVDGATAWTEWEFDGTRRDGTRFLMRGVIIFDVADSQAVAARLYLELVQNDGEINEAVRREVIPRG